MGLQTGKKVIGTKSRFIRRFISVLTVFALVAALLPVVPGAGITAEAAALSALYINEKIEGGINQSVDLSKDGSGSGWSYTAGTKTLTLNGFNGSYIEATGDLNMVLKGTNTITPAADAENAVKVDGTLTIDKSSSDDTDILKIKNTAMTGSGSYRDMLYGTTDVVINGGTVDIEVATSANSCLYGCCYVSLNGSSNLKIQVESGNTPYGAKQMKVYDAADVDVYVKGTNVYYFGGVAVTSLYARGSGQLNFVAESPEGKPVFAIESLWEAYLKEGGTITATGMVAQYHNNNQQLIGEKVTVSPAERIMDMKFYTGSYYNVYCDKEGTPYNSMTFTGTDTPQPLTYMDCSMWDIPAGKTGESMERIYLAKGLCGAKEGSAPRYEIIEGSLPDGITLYSWGDIDGTPTTECDAGTVKIRVTNTAKASEENTVEFEIAYGAISVPSPVTGVELDKHELILEAGASDTLNATVSPSNATVTTVDWSSDNSSIASVSGGTVKGNEAGKTTITVTTRQGGLKDTCTVYVKEKKPEVTTDGNYILGLVSGASYTVNGTAITADGGGRIAIEDAWRGTNVSIIKTNEEPKCTSDTATLDIPSVHTHVTTKVESNPSDCTKPGNKEYYICTICDAWYWDSAATQFIDNHANVVIAASHTLTHVEENGAKCDADGNKEYYTCSVCSKWYEDASATKEITDHNSVVIPAFHSITLVTSQASTCKVNGNKAYYTCSKCGKWYKDLDATTEITDHDSVVLPLAGHKDTDSNGKCDVCEATVSTPQPTVTPKVTATPQPTATPKVTATPQPTATPKVTATPQPTSEPQATARPVPGNPQTTNVPQTPNAPQATATPVPGNPQTTNVPQTPNAPQATGNPQTLGEQATQTPGEQATQAPAVGTKLNDSKSKAVYIITKSGLSGGTVEYYAPVSKTAKTAIIPATIKIGGITYKVTSIAKNAFKNNKKLKAITIKATGLKKIGKGAFRKISKKAVIRVPKSKLKVYTKMIKKTGIAKTVKIKK